MNIDNAFFYIEQLIKNKMQVNSLHFYTEISKILENFQFKSENGKIIKTNVNGLIGSSGIMPEHYTDTIYEENKLKNRALLAFYEIFSNRFLKLYYQTWQQSRVINASLLYDKNDQLAQLISAEKINYYQSLFAFRLRSKNALAQLISSYFALPCRKITSETLAINLANQHRCKLSYSLHFNKLGINIFLGKIAFASSLQLVIELGPLNSTQFNNCLNTKNFLPSLLELVRKYTQNEILFKLKFLLNPDIEGGYHSNKSPAYLGWNSWLGETPSLNKQAIEIIPF